MFQNTVFVLQIVSSSHSSTLAKMHIHTYKMVIIIISAFEKVSEADCISRHL